MEYTSFDNYMKQRFGGKVYRLSLSTGCTCPNRDGKCGTGGCIFCSAGGSGEFAADSAKPVDLQIAEAKERVSSKLSHNFAGYMAYFQSFTNTYFHNDKEFEDVKARFFSAARHPEIVAVSIATRPDCLSVRVLEMLTELNKIKPVMVELGLQTIHDETARIINRGYDTYVYDKAVTDLHSIGIGVVTHMIIGLPYETDEMITSTLRHVIDVSCMTNSDDLSFPDGIKLQLLHVLKGTILADLLDRNELNIHDYTLEEYSALLRHLVQMIPGEMIIHRLTGDPPKNLLISPLWAADKKKALNTIKKALEEC